MKNILIIFVAIMIVGKSSCQVTNKTGQAKFDYVELPDSVFATIRQFYNRVENRDSILGQITVFNVKNPKDFKFQEGIFRFRISGPHYNSYYFIYKKNKIHVFSTSNSLIVLNELKELLSSLRLSERENIELIELTTIMLREEYETEND